MAATTTAHHPFRSPEARERYLARYDERAKKWPVPSETRVVQTSQGETFVRISGPAGAPPVILLPGKWSDSLMWPAEMVEALSARYRLITVDNVFDFGRSVSNGGKALAADYVSWMDDLLDGLGIDDRVSIVGLSLGAWVAAEYALHAPERMAKMAWLSPGGVLAFPASIGTIPGLPVFMACAIKPTPATVRALMGWLMPRAARADGRMKRVFDEYVADVAFGLQSFAAIPAPMETDRRFSDAELRGIRTPVLYVAGQYDRFVPARVALARIGATVPQAQTMVFSGIGHEMIMAEPEALAKRVLDFLDA